MVNKHMNIKSWAKEDRPREKFALNGKGSLSNAELLAILIGTGNKDESAVELAKRILASAGNNLNELGKADVKNLMEFKGMGEAKAITIAAALELGRRRKKLSAEWKPKIISSKTAFELIEPHLSDLMHEEFWILVLDKSNRVIDKKNISKGGVSGTVADAKMIFKYAIEKLASAIILCHNHPSGNLIASREDIQLTKKLIEAGKNLDITILDHIIVGNNSYLSFADEALM